MNYAEACGILGVSTNDDLNAIKKCYRSRVKFYHPDNFQGNDEKLKYAEEMTKRVNEAWEYIQLNYETKDRQSNEAENHTEHMEESGAVYTYKYPVYEPIFTKTTIILTIVVMFIVFAKVLQSTFDQQDTQVKNIEEVTLMQDNQFDSQAEYTEEAILMRDFQFISVDGGYELSTVHSDFNGTVVIPEIFDDKDIICIGDNAFKNCEGITEIVIPNTVITIGRSAFSNCDKLRSVSIPDSVTEIVKVDFTSNGAFEDCDNLESVYVGKGITYLSYCTFAGCDKLTKVYLTSSIEEIAPYTFWGCKNIKNVYFDGTVEQWKNVNVDDTAFDNDISFTVVCTDGSIVYPIEEQYIEGE